MNEINRNYSGNEEFSENSFVSIFHETGEWNDDEYFKLESYLYQQCEIYKNNCSVPREIFWPAVSIYSYLIFTIGCHFDSNDAFELKGISLEEIYDRRERLQMVFEGFFKGKMPDKDLLGY